jgi:type I restriction enzyme M protein
MFKEATPNSIRVLKIGNITPFGEIDNSKSEFHEWSEKFENVLVGKGDFVVAMTGATVGKVARIIDGKFLLNQRVGCLRPNEQILPNYMKFILLEERFYNYCQSGADGGAQGNISPTGIKEYKFPLPSIEVQQQIVDELEGYQKIIDGCRQVVENYKPTIDIDPSWETTFKKSKTG